jgi:hypothetical protein
VILLLCSACSAPPSRERADRVGDAVPSDSLALSAPGGVEIWFTLARSDRNANGMECQERGLEIRRSGKRLPVPLLYTRERPLLLNDSTVQARLWTHCSPGDAYLVDLLTGRPTPARSRRTR